MLTRHLVLSVAALVVAMALPSCEAAEPVPDRKRLFIIGQDLGAVRDYYASECCATPDGNTMYLNFYALVSKVGGYGGLGMDLEGNPIEQEMDWGAGPASAWKSATEFEGGLAIGLSIVESDAADGLARIAAGEFDRNIKQLAAFISKIDKPVYLRIGYEFDGGWNAGYEKADNYIAAWRRIVDGLREAGASKVEYVWQSAAFPLDILNDGGYTDIRQWYPGDDYVDWLGFSLFLNPDEGPAVNVDFQPPTGRELIGKVLDLARERGKPVFIGEASPQGYDLARRTNANIAPTWDGPQAEGVREVSDEDIWNEWFAPVFRLMEEHRDVIYALAYINVNWDSQDMWDAPYESGYWGDSRLQVNPYVAERFNQAIERWRSMD
jgi:hypothetical protein